MTRTSKQDTSIALNIISGVHGDARRTPWVPHGPQPREEWTWDLLDKWFNVPARWGAAILKLRPAAMRIREAAARSRGPRPTLGTPEADAWYAKPDQVAIAWYAKHIAAIRDSDQPETYDPERPSKRATAARTGGQRLAPPPLASERRFPGRRS
jgi:hypothetical protein